MTVNSRQSDGDAYGIVMGALGENWTEHDLLNPDEVVTIAFTALDEEGDTTIPRDRAARDRAEVIVGMVFIDIGGDEGTVDRSAVASNMLRAACDRALDEEHPG